MQPFWKLIGFYQHQGSSKFKILQGVPQKITATITSSNSQFFLGNPVSFLGPTHPKSLSALQTAPKGNQFHVTMFKVNKCDKHCWNKIELNLREKSYASDKQEK